MSSNLQFIWPRSLFSTKALFSRTLPVIVEKRLKELYPNTFPVLFSSARSALSTALLHLGVSKLSHVWTPPYSSHCVLDSISRVGFPTPDVECASVAIIYHQWGYKQILEAKKGQIVIEDSADSFFLPGNIIFPNNGKLQVTSLPKSLGCSGGGVLFCYDEIDAAKIKDLRDSNKKSYRFHYYLKLLGSFNKTLYNYWDSYEAAFGFPTSSLCYDILNKLDKIDFFVEKVKNNRRIFNEANIIFDKCEILSDRLQCAIPLLDYSGYERTIGSLIKEYRNFNITGNYKDIHFQKVVPVPVHKDINDSFIYDFIKYGKVTSS